MFLDHPIQSAASLRFSWPEAWSRKGEVHGFVCLPLHCVISLFLLQQSQKFLLLKSWGFFF